MNDTTKIPVSILPERINTMIAANVPNSNDNMKSVDWILIFLAVKTVMTFCVPINDTINAKHWVPQSREAVFMVAFD